MGATDTLIDTMTGAAPPASSPPGSFQDAVQTAVARAKAAVPVAEYRIDTAAVGMMGLGDLGVGRAPVHVEFERQRSPAGDQRPQLGGLAAHCTVGASVDSLDAIAFSVTVVPEPSMIGSLVLSVAAGLITRRAATRRREAAVR